MGIEEYINALTPIRTQRVQAVVNYIREVYPHAMESMDYAPKTKLPTFKIHDVYVCVASMKGYVSLHFGKPGAVNIITDALPKIKSGVGCVKITDTTEFPMGEIKKAIDFCWGEA